MYLFMEIVTFAAMNIGGTIMSTTQPIRNTEEVRKLTDYHGFSRQITTSNYEWV
jgi:hypothetical protein